jgi:hypothetical protein
MIRYQQKQVLDVESGRTAPSHPIKRDSREAERSRQDLSDLQKPSEQATRSDNHFEAIEVVREASHG